MTYARWTRITATTALAALALTGCGGSEEAIGDPDAPKGSLAAVCPATVVVQTDWYATPERSPAYNLIGPDGEIDVDKGAYVGEIGDTGVTAEIRLGGPFIGGQPVTAQMYTDDTIDLGVVATDIAIRDYEKFPTRGVFTMMQKSPFMVMFDPAKFPEVKTWDDVKATGAPVLHAQGVSWVDYLVHEGLVDEKQLDGSFDGSPSRFVADDGALFQQGYVSNEPYRWEHDVAEWAKPTAHLMLADAGYQVYQQAYAVRADDEETLSPCLKELVPLLQQSEIDYLKDPKPVNDTLIEIADAIKDGPPITPGGNENSVKVQVEAGLVANGPDGAYGSFDVARVDSVIETMTAVLKDGGKDVPEITGDELVTNDYIDPEIKR